jgi:hypothetical protein
MLHTFLKPIIFIVSLFIIYGFSISKSNGQALDGLRQKVSPQEKKIYSQAINSCKSMIRERTKNPALQIYEPCEQSDQNWPGVEKSAAGYKFHLNVKPKNSDHAALMSAFLGESVRVICSSDFDGNIISLEDHKESVSELRSRPTCGYFRD